MFVFHRAVDLRLYLTQRRAEGMSIGFAPTMGALHLGHVSLIEQSRANNHLTVCSVFVNPTQFNDKKDLEKYPRTVGKDIQMLHSAGCDVLYLPSEQDVYPPGLETNVNLDLGLLDKGMEGAHRPGHFEGVVQVVKRLLDIVSPDRLYMGQKDYQQFAIIQFMIKELHIPVEIVCCPIVREMDGLAMSSRNVRLSVEARAIAPRIHETLEQAKHEAKHLTVEQVKSNAIATLSKTSAFSIDYFDIVDADTLQEVTHWAQAQKIIACTTIRLDGVRLLDNIFLKGG